MCKLRHVQSDSKWREQKGQKGGICLSPAGYGNDVHRLHMYVSVAATCCVPAALSSLLIPVWVEGLRDDARLDPIVSKPRFNKPVGQDNHE